jgi:hypothetical protein
LSDEATRLRPAFEDLKNYAEKEHVEIHPSFFVELKNYSRHEVVSNLSDADLKVALVKMGRHAISGGEKKVGAGAVRVTIQEWCDDPFSPCNRAAERLLKSTD